MSFMYTYRSIHIYMCTIWNTTVIKVRYLIRVVLLTTSSLKGSQHGRTLGHYGSLVLFQQFPTVHSSGTYIYIYIPIIIYSGIYIYMYLNQDTYNIFCLESIILIDILYPYIRLKRIKLPRFLCFFFVISHIFSTSRHLRESHPVATCSAFHPHGTGCERGDL